MRIPVRAAVIAAAGGIMAGALAACSTAGSAPAAIASQPRPAATPARPTPGRAPTATFTPTPAGPAAAAIRVVGAPRRVQARGAVLEDAATGTLLWSRDLNVERPIGSITKVMTALVVLRTGDLGRQIRIPQAVIAYVDKYGGNSAGLHPGDVLTVQQLLEAMLLPSGCDAAYTLAMAYGPGMPAFLAKMNATARQLGMLHTYFTSPDGLPYPTEYSTYSTPADLVTLGRAAMQQPVFRSIVDQSWYQIRKGPGHHAYWWNNTNDLIGTYPGADGIKDGFTNAALHCLLFEATRGDLTLIGAVLGSPATGPASGAQAAAQVLNWGFSLPRARPG
jgi:serine-type D-Ala-D-Ala carboxypeptidase (penicillin-binding protein 5/6)